MGHMFCCGRDGCHIIKTNEAASAYAGKKQKEWAKREKKTTGKFPSMKRQVEIFAEYYERHKNIRKHEP